MNEDTSSWPSSRSRLALAEWASTALARWGRPIGLPALRRGPSGAGAVSLPGLAGPRPPPPRGPAPRLEPLLHAVDRVVIGQGEKLHPRLRGVLYDGCGGQVAVRVHRMCLEVERRFRHAARLYT